MTVICDRCSAKHSVPDQKLGTKTYKARCRRCGHVLLVRRPPDPDAVRGAHPLAVWYALVGEQEIGPMTGAELRRRFGAGEIQPASLVWRDGYEDWCPVSKAVDLADLFVPLQDDGQLTRRVSIAGNETAQDAVPIPRPSETTQHVRAEDIVAEELLEPVEPEAADRVDGAASGGLEVGASEGLAEAPAGAPGGAPGGASGGAEVAIDADEVLVIEEPPEPAWAPRPASAPDPSPLLRVTPVQVPQSKGTPTQIFRVTPNPARASSRPVPQGMSASAASRTGGPASSVPPLPATEEPTWRSRSTSQVTTPSHAAAAWPWLLGAVVFLGAVAALAVLVL